MKRYAILILWFVVSVDAQLLSQRFQVPSDILQRSHELLIYTPPSYHFDKEQHFPVLYLMDGEYNFNYVTGLVELWSNISPRMPEMIVIGISGYESAYYRNLMRPPWNSQGEKSENGAADIMLEALIKEIKPAVSKQFRTAEMDMLSGHSMGGLFITYASFTAPQAFDHYLAISPSLWWQDETIKSVIGMKLKKAVPEVNLYMTLANEQGMGVHGFLEMIQAPRESELSLNFKQFPEESHGSVGLPSYEWFFKDVFKSYQLSERYFKDANAIVAYAERLKTAYGHVLPVNAAFLRNSCYANCAGSDEELKLIDEALEKHFPSDVAFFRVLVAKHFIEQSDFIKAESWLFKAAKQSPSYVDLHHSWYLLYTEKNMAAEADKSLAKVRKLLLTQPVRQWHINELQLPKK